MRLPPGYYYPVTEYNGYGLLIRNYRMEFYHPAGVMARDLIGQWFRAPGGINMNYDPGREANGFVRREGLNLAPGTFPPGAIQVIHRPGAWFSSESAFLRRQVSYFNQQQMARDGPCRCSEAATSPGSSNFRNQFWISCSTPATSSW